MKKIISTVLCICIITIAIPLCTVTTTARTAGDFEYSALDNETIQIVKYTGADSSLTIPSEIDGYTVTRIGWYAFRNCRELENVTIPETITDIGQEAFYGTAYYNNESNWKNGILYISNCLIATKSNDVNGKVVIKPDTRVIADYAFSECENMTEIELPDGLVSIGSNAFYRCSSLTSLVIPNSVKHINELNIVDYNALDKNKSALHRVVIGDGITTIPANMFRSCSNLTDVTLGKNVKTIESEAFLYTSIEEIIIPDNVEEIGYRAFFCCDFLSSVELGKGIKKINSAAFDSESISKVTYSGNSIQWGHVIVEDHNLKITDNIEFLEEYMEIADNCTENDPEDLKGKKSTLSYIIIFLVIAIIIIAMIVLLKKRGKGNYENK